MLSRRHGVTLMVGLWVSGCAPEQPPIDVSLDAPGPGQGFQLSIPNFEVPGGTEVQDCYFVKAPSVETWVNHVVIAQNPGTHHLNVFRLRTRNNLWGQPGDVVHGGECWVSSNWADWPLVANSQKSSPTDPVNDWTLPKGVALKFDPDEVLMVQTHYINAAVQKTPGTGKVYVNFYSTPKESVTVGELGTLFATNQNIHICPGEEQKRFTTTCRFATKPITITAANSHFHSHGVDFTLRATDAKGNESAPFYENHSWDDPKWATDMQIQIPENGGISYSCSFTLPPGDCGDPEDKCCVSFGPHNQTQEHCNVFAYYYPKLDSNVVCF